MDNQFASLFRDSGLSEADISQCSNEFSQVFFLALLGEAEPRLNKKECSEIEEYTKKGEIEKILALIKAKFPSSEFKSLIQKTFIPLIREYRSKVIA